MAGRCSLRHHAKRVPLACQCSFGIVLDFTNSLASNFGQGRFWYRTILVIPPFPTRSLESRTTSLVVHFDHALAKLGATGLPVFFRDRIRLHEQLGFEL